MMLQRREHFHPFNRFRQMQENMDRMWGRFDRSPHGHRQNGSRGFNGPDGWAAPMDVFSEGDEFFVRASMPGVAPENIQVSIEDNVLTIKGETASHFESSEGRYMMRERRSGTFQRSLRLPDTVDQDRVEPRYEHGVLTITMPRAETDGAKRFEVKVAEGPALSEAS